MSGKKTKKSPAKPSVTTPEEAHRRPTTLGLIVLVAGGISTWYWYKPLPPETTHGAYSDWTQAEAEGLWSNTDLIRPTLESLDNEFPSEKNAEVDGLVADAKKLVPVPVYRKNLTELMVGEIIPTIPTATDIPAVQVATPKVWTNSSDDSHSMLSSGSAPSNSTHARSLQANSPEVRSLDWPDQNFEPASQQPAPKPAIATNAPSLLPTSSVNVPRAIRTNEDAYGGSQTFTETANQTILQTRTLMPSKDAIPDLATSPAPEPARSPQFIRQPKK